MNRRKFIRNSLAVATAATVPPPPSPARSNRIISLTPTRPSAQPLSAEPVFRIARLRYASGNWDADPQMPANLLHSLAEYTPVRVDPTERIIDIGSERIFDYPFVYLTGNKSVRLTDHERANLRHYLRGGGFLFADDCDHNVNGVFARTFESEIKIILDRPEEKLRRLPNNHPLYDAFFEFPGGPPATSHELNGWGDRLTHDYLRAVETNGRVGVLYSNKDYGCEWNCDPANKRFAAIDSTRFGVNIIVYALTTKSHDS